MSDLNTEIKIGADASGVEAGVGRAKRSLNDLGAAAKKAGKDAGDGVGSIGAGGDKAARDVERATKSMQGSLQRLLAEQKSGAKGSREYYEALADTRGISRNAIKPILDQIDAAKNKTLQAKTAADSWTASLGKVGPLVAAAFSGAAITGFLGKVVAVQREFDVLNSSLTTVTGSSAAAERELMWLKDFAKETPFGLAQATQGFVKMKALGLDPTRAALTSFGNTASAMGKDLNQMIEAVADASTGEFERLKEFGIKAKKEGDSVSLTFQGVTTTIRNSAAEITKYLQDIGDTEFGGAVEQRAKTLDGTIAALGETWDELFRTVSQNNVGSLIFDSVTLANGVLEDATTLLRAMGSAAQDAGRDTGALATIQNGIATVFETVAVLGANLKFVLVSIGNEIGGLAAQVAQAAQFNFSGVAAIRQAMVADAEAARKEIDTTTERILRARKAQEEYARFATRNASAATDPRRVDLSTPAPSRGTGGGGKSKKEELSDYDKLIQKLGVEIPKAAAEAEAAQMGYNKAQTEFLALAGSDVWAKFTDTQRATVAALFENKIVSEQAGEAAKTLAKANLDAAAARDKYLTSLATGIDKLKADIAAQQEATARMGLTKDAIAELDGAKLEMLATDLELQAIKALDRNLDQQTYDSLKEQAKLYRDLSAAKKDGAAKEIALDLEKANEDAAKDAAKEWERAAEDINRSLTDALLRGFESGKGFAENLRDTIKNMFSTLVLRPIISAVLSPIAGGIQGFLGGGAGGAAGGGGIGGLMNLASLGKNAYSLYSGGLSGLTAPGSAYYNLATSGIGQGLGLSNAAPIIGNNVSAFAPAGTQLTSPFSGGMTAAGGAGIFAAVVGIVLNALGAFKSERKIGGGLMGTLGSGDLSPWEEWREGGTLFSGPSFSTMNPVQELEARRAQLQALKDNGQGNTQQAATLQVIVDNLENLYGDLADQTKAQSKAIQTAYDALRTNVGDMADVLGLSSEAVRKFTTHLGGSDKGLNFEGLTGEQIAAKITEALATANNDLAQQVIGSFVTTTTTGSRIVSENIGSEGEDRNIIYTNVAQDPVTSTRYVESEYAREGEKAIDTLTRLATSLSTVNDVFDTLGVTLLEASLSGGDAASAFADAFGGLERLAAITADYYQNFYTEEERRAKAQEKLNAEFADLGIDVPKNRDEFRKLVDDTLNQVEVQRAGRDKIRETIGSGISGKLSLEDLGKTGILDNIDPALYGGGAANPEVAGKLNDFLQGVNALADKGLDPATFDKGLADLVALNSEVLGMGKDANETAARILGLSNTFAQLTESADEAAARIAKEEADARGKAFAALERAIAKEKEVLQSQIDIAQDVASTMGDLFDLLHDNVRELYAEVDSTRGFQAEQGSQFIAQALAAARTSGYLPDADQLAEAIGGARGGLDENNFRSGAERDFATLVLAGQLKGLEDITGRQLTDAQRTVKELESQSEQLDKTLTYWREQIDIANGTYEATLSVADAIANLTSLMFPEVGVNKPDKIGGGGSGGAVFGGSSGSGGGATTPQSKYKRPVSLGTAGTGYVSVTPEEEKRLDQFNSGYRAFDGTGDAAGLAAFIAENKLSPEDMSALSGLYATDWDKWYRENGIPAYEVGTNFVPRTGLAMLHQGEAVIPKAYNPAANPGMGGQSNARLEALVEKLTAEVAELKGLQSDGNTHTGQLSEQFNNWSQGGQGAGRVEVTNEITVAA